VNWAENLTACIASAAALARFKVEAPQYDAHVAAYHAWRNREIAEFISRQPPTPRWRKSNRCGA
jgi:hypothetical protein